MSTERERLVKLLDDAYKSVPSSVHSHRVADALLAAGIKLPPEPPRLVTEDLLAPIWDDTASRMLQAGCLPTRWKDVPPSARPLSIDHANRVTESAIRRAVERKRDGDHVRLDADGKHCAYIQHVSTRSLLALFGLDGGVP